MYSSPSQPKSQQNSLEYPVLQLIPHRSLGNYHLDTSLESILRSSSKTLSIYYSDHPKVTSTTKRNSTSESKKKHSSKKQDVLSEKHNIIIVKHPYHLFLYFEEKWQKLEMIRLDLLCDTKNEVNNDSSSTVADDDYIVKVMYQEEELHPSFSDVYRLMGPTHKGKYDKERLEYTLEYPGVAYVFDIPLKWNDQALWPQGIPVEFNDKSTPQLKRIFVYKGRRLEIAIENMLNLHSPADDTNPPIQVFLGKGITIGKNNIIRFNDTTQNVLALLGPPSQVFYKKHDKLKIFAPNSSRSPNLGEKTSTAVDYFFNYFKLGIDILFRGDTHKVKKIILHTNFCGSTDFNVYTRCNFFIPYNEFFKVNNIPVPSHLNHDIIDLHSHDDCNGKELEDMIPSENFNPDEGIEPLTLFNEVLEVLQGIHCGEPVANHSRLKDNPFGGTEFYPLKFCIIETLQNKHINSITLFSY